MFYAILTLSTCTFSGLKSCFQGRFQGGPGAAAPPVKFVPPCGPPKNVQDKAHQASEQKASAALVVILNVFLMLSCFVTF